MGAFCVLVGLLIVNYGSAQIWETGDNATVIQCNTCEDYTCARQTAEFYDRELYTSLKHFLTVQINMDKWHRARNTSRNMAEITNAIKGSFPQSGNTTDLYITDEIQEEIQIQLKNSIVSGYYKLMTRAIQWQCPLPCSYRRNSYQDLLNVSMVLIVFNIGFVTYALHKYCSAMAQLQLKEEIYMRNLRL